MWNWFMVLVAWFLSGWLLAHPGTSWQHLWSCQDGYWLVTVHTNGDFIVLPHWDTMTWYHTQSHYPGTELTNQFLPYLHNGERLARKWQVPILKSSVWLDQVSNQCVRILHSPKIYGCSTHSAVSSGLVSQWGSTISYTSPWVLALIWPGILSGR